MVTLPITGFSITYPLTYQWTKATVSQIVSIQTFLTLPECSRRLLGCLKYLDSKSNHRDILLSSHPLPGNLFLLLQDPALLYEVFLDFPKEK